MTKIEKLEKIVTKRYLSKKPNRDEWADDLFLHHVTTVANFASEVAARFDIDQDLSRAGALLHDIADSEMRRRNARHEERSLEIAEEILKQSGFGEKEIDIFINDALPLHSCRDGKVPKSDVGKVLATADALAHLKTDFYIYAARNIEKNNLQDIKNWVLEKSERDWKIKIQFNEIREEVREDYKAIQQLFSR